MLAKEQLKEFARATGEKLDREHGWHITHNQRHREALEDACREGFKALGVKVEGEKE